MPRGHLVPCFEHDGCWPRAIHPPYDPQQCHLQCVREWYADGQGASGRSNKGIHFWNPLVCICRCGGEHGGVNKSGERALQPVSSRAGQLVWLHTCQAVAECHTRWLETKLHLCAQQACRRSAPAYCSAVVERHRSFHASLQAALSSGCSNTDLSTSLLTGERCAPECAVALKGGYHTCTCIEALPVAPAAGLLALARHCLAAALFAVWHGIGGCVNCARRHSLTMVNCCQGMCQVRIVAAAAAATVAGAPTAATSAAAAADPSANAAAGPVSSCPCSLRSAMRDRLDPGNG